MFENTWHYFLQYLKLNDVLYSGEATTFKTDMKPG